MSGSLLPNRIDAVTDGGDASITHAQEVAAATVEALARALELHDYRRGRFGETAAHTARVTRLAMLLAGQFAPELTLDPQLAYGFRLHDIGMIGDLELDADEDHGALSPAEIDEIREHPWLGERIVAPVPAARRSDAAGDRVPSRALERLGLPARAARDRDPGRRPRLLGHRRVRRDDERAALPGRALSRRLRGTRFTRRPGSTSTRMWSKRSSRSSCRLRTPSCRFSGRPPLGGLDVATSGR